MNENENPTVFTTEATTESAAADPRDARIAELEAELAQAKAAAAAGVQDLSTGTKPPEPDFGTDVEARKAELVAQGVPEAEAEQQAQYERKLWEDQHGAAPATDLAGSGEAPAA